MIGSATSRTSRPLSDPKPSITIPASSSGATTGSPSALPSWKSSAPQPGGDVDDAGALVLADLVPRDDAVHVRRRRVVAGPRGERRPDGGQLVERAGVPPADELGAGDLVLDRERPDRGPA